MSEHLKVGPAVGSGYSQLAVGEMGRGERTSSKRGEDTPNGSKGTKSEPFLEHLSKNLVEKKASSKSMARKDVSAPKAEKDLKIAKDSAKPKVDQTSKAGAEKIKPNPGLSAPQEKLPVEKKPAKQDSLGTNENPKAQLNSELDVEKSPKIRTESPRPSKQNPEVGLGGPQDAASKPGAGIDATGSENIGAQTDNSHSSLDPKVAEAHVEAFKSMRQVVAKAPVISLLTGHLEELNPGAIVNIVSFNSFLQNALTEGNLDHFFATNIELRSFLEDLDLSETTLAGLEAAGINLSAVGSHGQFLKLLGVDPQRVRSEVELLKSNLSLGSIEGYLTRARALTKNLGAPVENNNQDLTSNNIPVAGLGMGSETEIQVQGLKQEKSNYAQQSGELPNSETISQLQTQKSLTPNSKSRKAKAPYLDGTQSQFSPLNFAPFQVGGVLGAQGNLINGMSKGPSKTHALLDENGGYVMGNDLVSLGLSVQVLPEAPIVDGDLLSGGLQGPLQSEAILRGNIGDPSTLAQAQKATFDHWYQQGKSSELEEVDLKLELKMELNEPTEPSKKALLVESDFDMVKQKILPSDLGSNVLDLDSAEKTTEKLELKDPMNQSQLLGFEPSDFKVNKAGPQNGGPSYQMPFQAPSVTSRLPDSLVHSGFGLSSESFSKAETSEWKSSDVEPFALNAEAYPKSEAHTTLPTSQSSMSGGFQGQSGGQDSFFGQDSKIGEFQGLTTQERVQLTQKIFDSAQLLATQGGGQMRFSMPETPWGQLNVAIQMVENKIDIRFGGVEEQHKDGLIGELATLSKSLEGRNIEIGKIEIVKPAFSSEQFLARGGQDFGHRQNLEDHQIHREWLSELRTQASLMQRPLAQIYKST